MSSIRVLFLAATEVEMAPVRERLSSARGHAWRTRCTVTGVGKASAAAAAAISMAAFRPRLTLFVGCAGSYPGSTLAPGDVVVATREILGDEGVRSRAGFLDLWRMGLASCRHSGDEYFNELPLLRPQRTTLTALRRLGRNRFRVLEGRLATVSTCSGTPAAARELARRTRALGENMEGAGAAIAALLLDRRLAEVRGISNAAGRRNKASWDISTACDRAAEIALHLAQLELGARS